MIADEEQARSYVATLADSEALGRIERLIDCLEEENRRQNLVAAKTMPLVWRRHVADSAQLIALAGDPKTGIWLDLGSGAGFPGLVVAAMRPDWPVVLVESRRRRIEWLERMIGELGLSQCRVEGRRLEAVPDLAAAVISARAFAPLDRLLALSARFSTGGTRWLLPKGRSAEQEIAGLGAKARAMFHVEQSKTDANAGIIVGQGQWSRTA